MTFVTMLRGNFWLLQIFPTSGNSNEQALSVIISYGQGPFAIYGYLIWVVLLAPIFEELFFRLILMTSYFKQSLFYIDVLLSSFSFMAVHMHSWSDFGTPFAPTFFITGISFGLVFKWTKSIIWVILLHITNNAFANWDSIEAFI
ncbi:CPBP family intramembrane glutamic endopeptidase [Streptococcus hyovaginalis]|uniref:CPBP family intramembrane glutamic endopeptidase n=1 Tax=Streptococcus hyovaginalis TaxID=149015 RepID=UPI002A801633|nr:CPBP family intramembrane glutamic endopeptidase [Streptococcus hyovaginalis]MDY4511448.1 CPBP family intramembrane glutamic endopeptidase [Streptococcus hyovaginalis]